MSAPITSIFLRRGCSTAVTSTFVRRIALYNKPRILSYNILNNNIYSITALKPPKSVSFYHQSHHHLTKMQSYPGSCFCHKITYNLNLSSPDDARTSLCHCRSCKVSLARLLHGYDLRSIDKCHPQGAQLTNKYPGI